MTIFPSHIGDMYSGSDESNTTRSNKTDVVNKKNVTNNCYEKLIMKNRGWRTKYENNITNNQAQTQNYPKMVIKKWLSKVVMK
jgi:hypothetical protein